MPSRGSRTRIMVATVGAALVATAGLAQPMAKPMPSGLERLNDDLRALAERVSPSVVQVVASGYSTAAPPGSVATLSREQATGSGVALDDGYVLTNVHVVDGASDIYVLARTIPPPGAPRGSILGPRSRRLPAKLVGLDRQTDVALLKVEGVAPPALAIGDSQDLHQGQIVLAFGSPLGLENSVSMGVVSAASRQLRPEDTMIYVQTDAAINPGNSGGPLVDTQGRMVGLNTMIFSQSGGNEGIGFAIPSHIVMPVTRQLRQQGRVRRGWIGARTQTVTPTMARGLGLDQEYGVIVCDVVAGGPAATAGLRVGDIVASLDERPMENARQLEVNLYRRSVGEAVSLVVRRQSTTQTLSVPVVERLEDPERFIAMVTPERNLIPRLGILGIELDPDVLKLLPDLRGNDGVVVAARVGSFGPEDLQPGDVIHAVNGLSVQGLAELRSATAAFKKMDAVVLQIERGGRLQYLAFEINP